MKEKGDTTYQKWTEKFDADKEFGYEQTNFNIALALRNLNDDIASREQMEGNVEFSVRMKDVSM